MELVTRGTLSRVEGGCFDMTLPNLCSPILRRRYHGPDHTASGLVPSTGWCRGCFAGISAHLDCEIYGTQKVAEHAPGFDRGFVCTNANAATWNCAVGEVVCITPDDTGTYLCF